MRAGAPRQFARAHHTEGQIHHAKGSPARRVWTWLTARANAASRLGTYGSLAFLAATAFYGAALGGQLAVWQARVEAQTEAALVAAGFGIREVVVRGRDNLPQGRLDEALNASHVRTIFEFDTRAAKARLEEIGWVKKARVMRLWPSTLLVELTERTPFARWDIRGHTVLIDRQGALLGPVTPAFSRLPRIAGEGADTAAATLLATLKRYDGIAVSLARRVERRRWDLVLSDGLRVQLPAGEADTALPVLRRLLDGDLPDGVATIDMRVPERIALRRAPGAESPGPTARLSRRDGRAQAQAL